MLVLSSCRLVFIDQIFGPRCAKVSVPYLTVLTLRVLNLFSDGYRVLSLREKLETLFSEIYHLQLCIIRFPRPGCFACELYTNCLSSITLQKSSLSHYTLNKVPSHGYCLCGNLVFYYETSRLMGNNRIVSV